MDIAKQIAEEIGKPVKAVENVIALLDEGNTIPFIARYRKEAHVPWMIRRFVLWKSGLSICGI